MKQQSYFIKNGPLLFCLSLSVIIGLWLHTAQVTTSTPYLVKVINPDYPLFASPVSPVYLPVVLRHGP